MEEEFQKVINKLLKNRAPGPDNIINKVIRVVAPLILKKLAQIVIKYLVISLSKELKKLFTLILKKKEKKNYLLPGTYKPIVLKNISVKLAKKILARSIVGKVEVEILLL